MKKIILLFSIILYCFTSKASTLTFNFTPSTVSSGGTVTVTVVGETSASHITALTLYSTYGNGGPSAAIVSGSLSPYNSGVPTTFQMIFTNPYPNPISLGGAFNVTGTDANSTGIMGFPPVTVNPSTVPTTITVPLYLNSYVQANFNLTVNGTYMGNISGTNNAFTTLSNSNSTIVLTKIIGAMPSSAVMTQTYGPNIIGKFTGSYEITFSGVNLSYGAVLNVTLH